MKKLILPIAVATILFTSCDVTKKDSAELPEVDVDVDAEAGELPEYDVDWADVDISTRTETVEVPKLVVVMEEEEVEVPTIDVNMPDEENIERSLVVEAEIADTEKSLDIQEVRASNKMLFVIAKLEDMGTDLQDKKMRIQDQVNLNAPDMSVKYIIIGERPDRVFNNMNAYYNAMEDLPQNVKDADVIYSRS
ncbi:hypothetical protein DSM03_103172 [Leeuwenhoekiella aestuarii]|uniref:Uncharacterized protein n=1 Tax=Leeuwenhoekiella aestuarii TaxID=2249426 RepID=A0A4Q0NXU2_9FLAO|nr:hypothetical protein [Leeuwenhoekiella aestuarii]RXG15987.1 hypothetical protein DSM03_103172 [Leeuwenhoekiella aestuarii]RXG16681.1 hypothetical protein DSM04_102262 [Leeuwenhoekiella aestuarii]